MCSSDLPSSASWQDLKVNNYFFLDLSGKLVSFISASKCLPEFFLFRTICEELVMFVSQKCIVKAVVSWI